MTSSARLFANEVADSLRKAGNESAPPYAVEAKIAEILVLYCKQRTFHVRVGDAGAPPCTCGGTGEA